MISSNFIIFLLILVLLLMVIALIWTEYINVKLKVLHKILRVYRESLRFGIALLVLSIVLIITGVDVCQF